MERNEQQRNVLQKAEFYFQEKIEAHVLLIPKPKFKNGLLSSELIKNKHGEFYWFIPKDASIPIKLFLFEIFDIEDYQEERR